MSISRVYPCVNYLRKGLKSSDPFNYTKQMRQDLLESLELGFKDVEENDAYLFSTYLDPVLGYKAFDKQIKQIVKDKIFTVLPVEKRNRDSSDKPKYRKH